jgi:hypothetical protein
VNRYVAAGPSSSTYLLLLWLAQQGIVTAIEIVFRTEFFNRITRFLKNLGDSEWCFQLFTLAATRAVLWMLTKLHMPAKSVDQHDLIRNADFVRIVTLGIGPMARKLCLPCST